MLYSQRKQGIVAFAFGQPHTIEPNKRLAGIAAIWADQHQASIFTQRDCQFDSAVIGVEYIAGEDTVPPSTLRLARAAVEWAVRNQIAMLWIVAAVPHVTRCQRDLEYAIKEYGATIEVDVCRLIWRYPRDTWFCPGSTQPRVQSHSRWRWRELLLRVLPMWAYRRKAS